MELAAIFSVVVNILITVYLPQLSGLPAPAFSAITPTSQIWNAWCEIPSYFRSFLSQRNKLNKRSSFFALTMSHWYEDSHISVPAIRFLSCFSNVKNSKIPSCPITRSVREAFMHSWSMWCVIEECHYESQKRRGNSGIFLNAIEQSFLLKKYNVNHAKQRCVIVATWQYDND